MSTIQLFTPSPSARVPSYRTVILNQFRLIGASKRFTLLLLVVAAGIMLVLNEKAFDSPLEIAPIPVLLFAAMVWPIIIWHGETRTRRTYHRWLPVDQVAHDFAKIIAGGIWLAIACLVTLATLKILALLIYPGAALSTGAAAGVVLGALLVYGFFSVLPIVSDKPLHWFIAIWPGWMLVSEGMSYFGPMGRYLSGVFFAAPLGINTAVLGAMEFHRFASPEQVVQWLPYVGSWLVALTLWSILLVCSLYLASRWANRSTET